MGSKLKLFHKDEPITDYIKELKVECPKCGSTNADLIIDFASYPEASWFYLKIECHEWKCETTTIYEE
jgi:hypothetical protein